MSGGFGGILSNLQSSTVATFVDFPSIVGLGVINYTAAIGKSLLSPVMDGGMLGMFIASCVEGTHDLVKFYYLKSSAMMPVTNGTTTAG